VVPKRLNCSESWIKLVELSDFLKNSGVPEYFWILPEAETHVCSTECRLQMEFLSKITWPKDGSNNLKYLKMDFYMFINFSTLVLSLKRWPIYSCTSKCCWIRLSILTPTWDAQVTGGPWVVLNLGVTWSYHWHQWDISSNSTTWDVFLISELHITQSYFIYLYIYIYIYITYVYIYIVNLRRWERRFFWYRMVGPIIAKKYWRSTGVEKTRRCRPQCSVRPWTKILIE